jgi:carbamoyl-phosphate synthase large subunit
VNALTVLVTASGSRQTGALLRALRMNGERRLRLIGTDISPDSIGRHYCDAFFVVPPGGDAAFAEALLGIAAREGVDVIIPQSRMELPALGEARERFAAEGVLVLVSPPEAVRLAHEKSELFGRLARIGVPAPAWHRVTGGRALRDAAQALGYPERAVRVEIGSAARVLDATVDRVKQLSEVPSPRMRLTEALEILPEDGGPELLVSELVEGPARTTVGIARGGRLLLALTQTHEAESSRALRDPALLELAERIVRELGLDHFFTISFVGDRVVGASPCLSALVYQEDLNLPYLGVKHALGEISGEELAAYAARVRPTRRALRYVDQAEWDELPSDR